MKQSLFALFVFFFYSLAATTANAIDYSVSVSRDGQDIYVGNLPSGMVIRTNFCFQYVYSNNATLRLNTPTTGFLIFSDGSQCAVGNVYVPTQVNLGTFNVTVNSNGDGYYEFTNENFLVKAFGVQIAVFSSAVLNVTSSIATGAATGTITLPFSFPVNITNIYGRQTTFPSAPSQAPAAPYLVAPANLANLSGTSVTLTWSAVNGAAAYDVLLKYGSPAITVPISLQTGTSVTLSSLLPGVYSWNVASCINTSSNSPANCSNYSETRGFTLAAFQGTPASPTLLSPTDQTVISGSSVDFSWSSVAGAAGYSFYIYNRTTNADVLSPAVPPTQTSTGIGISNLGPGIYSWNVASCFSLAVYSSTNCPNLSATRTIRSLSGPLQLSRRGGIDIDGNNKSAIVVRSAAAQLQAGRLVNNQFQFSSLQDPGPSYRLIGVGDFFRSGKSDLAFQNMTQGTLGDIKIWRGFSPSNEIFWRQVKQVWDVQAGGDLDGDGFGDLVWRYVVTESPDTGVSYIWFTNGSTVTQVRKRGGAPLDWTLLGAADLNGDGAADMVYINPSNQARALMATANRTCANVLIGNIPTNMAALRLADFTGNGRGEILLRDKSTGAVSLLRLNAAGLTLPPFTGSPDDQNASCTGSTLQVASTTLPILNADPAWQFYASGDFNGDGIVDIVWQQPSGTLTLWLMNADGAAPTVIQNAGTAPAGFTVFQK